MIKRIPVIITDKQRKNMKDRFLASSLKGRVLIHEKKVGEGDDKLYLVEDTSNLIVYRGRNWLMQRAFNTDMTNRTGWKDRYISWFAVGTGGQAGGGDPLVPASPTLQDYALGAHGTIAPASATKLVTVDGKQYINFDTGFPKYAHDPDIDFDLLPTGCTATDPIDSLSYKCDGFLIAHIQVTLGSGLANNGGHAGGDPALEYQDLSEASIFCAPTSDPASISSGDMSPFARVCFSTVRKNIDRELQFTWLIYF